jgi:alpha-L-rhamnosidase
MSASATHLDAGQQTAARMVSTTTPALSWRLPAGWVAQQSAELEARIDTVTHSAAIDSRRHVHISWPWAPLGSRSTVEWRVRARGVGATGAVGWSEWSAWSAFETPLFSADDWSAEWISPVENRVETDRPAYLLERTFTLDQDPSAARLYATALGLYEAFLNGTRVGDLELTPGSANYDETVYAQAYDVTGLLRAGTNHLALVLSDGWYRGRNGGMQRQNAWGTTTAALAQVDVATAAGPRTVVATDDAWTFRPSTIVRADLMTGQTTDFTVPEGPSHPVVPAAMRPPLPRWSPAPAPRRVEELVPVAVSHVAPGVTVFDFGQNVSGWVRLNDLGPTGAQTELEFAEHVTPEGDITTAHLDIHTPEGGHLPYRQIDRVIAGPGGSEFEPRHTVHGFRYVRVRHEGRELDAHSVRAVVVHSDLHRTGRFESSDPDLDRLHEAVVWSFRDNVVDVPTDCPTRERSGWTGDFQVFAPTASFLFTIDGFSRKWLQAVRDDQYTDGSLAMFSPDSERMKHSDNPSRVGGGSAGWGDAAVAVPWTLYQNYGDVTVLAESWESARAWVEFALRSARNGRHPSRIARTELALPHEQFVWDATFHFGEWLEPVTDAPAVDPATAYQAFMTADKGEVATAYLFRSTQTLAAIARILGRTDEATHYDALSHSIRSAWQTEFLRPGGRTVSDTQAAYVRALDFGLIPEQHVSAAADRLVELVESTGHLTTGFLSTGLLLPVLADTGHADTAFALLAQRGTPSWLGMLDRGATTVWEEWNGVSADGTAKASLNHYSKGAVARFFYSHLAGLRQDADSTAWRRFRIRPVVGGGITSVAVDFESPLGPIGVRWHRDADRFALEADIPPGSTARVDLPDGPTRDVGPGQHHFVCRPPRS